MCRFLIQTLILLAYFPCKAQNSSDTSYKYSYRFYSRLGLKDRSFLLIHTSYPNKKNDSNVAGTITSERKINNGNNDSRRKDWFESSPSRARLILISRKDTIEEYVDNVFKLKLPVGKYRILISRVGMGYINKTLRIRKNTTYTFDVILRSRRVIADYVYECKSKMTRKEYKAIRKHYKLNKKVDTRETNCDCKIKMIVYD